MSDTIQLTPRVFSPNGEPWSDHDIYAMMYRNALDTTEEREHALLISIRIEEVARAHSMLLPRLHHSQDLARVTKAALLSTMGIFMVVNEEYPEIKFRQAMFYQVIETFCACLGLPLPTGREDWDHSNVCPF